MKTIIFAAAGLSMMLLAGCGRGQDNPDQPSADERSKLDNIAATRDQREETFDTSPDSLKPADDDPAATINTPAPASDAGSNGANQAAPR